jgi:ATP-dependent Clp protease ATP-binding subunit ClpX
MIGFGASALKKKEYDQWDLIQQVETEDILKYGMIPEFIGRLPVLAPLHQLSEDALVQILTQPKNALVKQYQKLFEMDGIKLKFTKTALAKVANLASTQKSGARGLRAILENALLETMYEAPGQTIAEVVVNEEAIEMQAKPLISYGKEKEPRPEPAL